MTAKIPPLFLLALSLGLQPLTAMAQTYIGTVCLLSTVQERETGPVAEEVFIIKYDVTHLGGLAYSIAGAMNNSNAPFVLSGHGTVIGNELYMNMTSTQGHGDGWQDTGINQTRLNLTTMTGTFYEIGHDFNPASKAWDNRYTRGTVAQVSCP